MENIKLIPLTQGQFAILDAEDFERIEEMGPWCYLARGYGVKAKPNRKGLIYMHRKIIKVKKGIYLDHINGNKLDNRKINLRKCTRQQNNWNVPPNKRNKTGFKGVTFNKNKKRYTASLKVNKVKYTIGTFDCPVEAAKAYDLKALELYGEFAWLNFPKK